MSIVAIKVHNGSYEISADSITVRDASQRTDSKLAKLFEVNGMHVGGVGLAEETSLFQLFLATHNPSEPTEKALLELLGEFTVWKKSRTDDSNVNNDYIIGLNGKGFYVSGWLITEVTNYQAIGAGSDFATAAMYLGHSATEAVRTAIALSIYCEGPIRQFVGVVTI